MIPRLRIFVGVLAIAGALSSSTAKADNLNGTTVTGSITTFDTILVTTQFTSPAVVGPGVEFNGVVHVPSPNNTYDISADFYNGGLTVSMTRGNGSSVRGPELMSLTFSDLDFVTPFTLQSATCAAGTNECSDWTSGGNNPDFLSNNTLSGSTLTLGFTGLFSGTTYTFTDAPATAATPEPSAFVLLGTGLLGVAGVVRRRFA
jgi:hypothetical protein